MNVRVDAGDPPHIANVPETWDELMALTQQIADDGDPAWCIGIESGAGTGWVATDWIENIMLRTTSPHLDPSLDWYTTVPLLDLSY
jgi:ABC-type glycerol-3-phosphate transport system substrate-binding protein